MIDLTEYDELIDQFVWKPDRLIKDISTKFTTESLGKMLASAGWFKCDNTYYHPHNDGSFEVGYSEDNMDESLTYARYPSWTCAVIAIMHTKNLYSFPELAEMDIDD